MTKKTDYLKLFFESKYKAIIISILTYLFGGVVLLVGFFFNNLMITLGGMVLYLFVFIGLILNYELKLKEKEKL